MQDKEKDLEYYRKDFEEYKKSLKGEMTKEEEEEAKKNAEKFLKSLIQARFNDLGLEPIDEDREEEVRRMFEEADRREADILSKNIEKALEQFKNKVDHSIASIDRGMNEAYKKLEGKKETMADVNITDKFNMKNTMLIIPIDEDNIVLTRSAVEDMIYRTVKVELLALKKNKSLLAIANSYVDSLIKTRQYKIYSDEDMKKLRQKSEAIVPSDDQYRVTDRYKMVFSGQIMDDLASMGGIRAEYNEVNDAVFTKEGTEAIVNSMKLSTLGVNCHKLLMTAIAGFTAINNKEKAKNGTLKKFITIPIEQYASVRGYKVIEEPKETEEEQAIEKKRAENALRDARKQFNKDVDILAKMNASWREKSKKYRDNNNIEVMNFFQKGKLGDNHIQFLFSDPFTDYLVGLPVSEYDMNLQAIDGRNTLAYALAYKIQKHSSITNNRRANNCNLLSVNSLLKATSLPTYEEVKSIGQSWNNRIKEPMEKALEELIKQKFIKEWRYSKPKGIELTDEEASFNSYYEWSKTLVWFDSDKIQKGLEEAKLDNAIDKLKDTKSTRKKHKKNTNSTRRKYKNRG